MSRLRQNPARPRVLIAGAGVAGLETLLALRTLAGDRVAVTLLAPELKFINHSMASEQPFKPQRVRGIRLQQVATEFDACFRRGALDRVEHEQRRAITKAGERLHYDMLVLALGAVVEPDFSGALTYRDGRDGPDYRLLLHRLREGRIARAAFVRPPGVSWQLPLYDLALLTAAHCAAHARQDVELSLVTPEEEPLGVFGKHASVAIRRLLQERRVTLYTSSYGVANRPDWLHIAPGDRGFRVDQIVTQPPLGGQVVPGVPFDCDRFIRTDAHGRVPDLDGVFAAGDLTSFPVKDGGLAAQQADAVAETIAAAAGADIDPQPFRPVLRGVLLTGRRPRYLRADISGRSGDDSAVSDQALWWPPAKLAGRFLGPYLARQIGDALDVHQPDDPDSVCADLERAPCASDGRELLTDLALTSAR